MGAFLIASVSMFVSCKDYDDDISKNSQEITALKSQLESLKSSLSSELSAAKAQADLQKEALENFQKSVADAGTGNDKSNDRLAAGRADAVVKALKEKCGIAQERIAYDSKGTRVQPFAENDLNRVTICITE